MATPRGPAAAAKRAYYRRQRRLLKKGLEDYGAAGHEPPPFRVLEWFVDDAGSGYAVGDQVEVLGGTPGRTPVVARVTEVTAGAVDAVVPVSGNYLIDPGTALATNALTGSGDNLLTLEPSLTDIHNFGPIAAPGGDGPFPLLAESDTVVAFEPSVAMPAGDFQVDVQGFETFESAEAVDALAVGYMRRIVPKGRTWTITRGPTAPVCEVKIYYRIKSQLVQIGTVQFT